MHCAATLRRLCLAVALAAAIHVSGGVGRAQAPAGQLTEEAVLRSIERARNFLVRRQKNDGSWSAGVGRYRIGVSSLALLALINSGLTPDDEPVQRGLKYLRSVIEPDSTYELALMIMALADAKDDGRDRARILSLAQKLEDSQIKTGNDAGSWSYGESNVPRPGGDRSNAQYAVLGLHAAVQAGIPVDRETWERVRRHWETQQSFDGGWAYVGSGNVSSTGSMTVAGIATLTIVDIMLQDDSDVGPDGKPDCCGQTRHSKALDDALAWMGRHFGKGDHNPGSRNWYLYYLYGLERAGRLSGRRLFGDHDWYREVAANLLRPNIQAIQGHFRGDTSMENDEVVGTSLALLFLSKGLAPVLINKLQYGPFDPADPLRQVEDINWNRHTNDVRNLTNHITGLEKWPKLVTWQVVEMPKLLLESRDEAVQTLRQSPMLYIGGKDSPLSLLQSPEAVEILREYVNQGGFLFAVANCEDSRGFHTGVQELVRRMYPKEQRELKPLPPDHEVYRVEYPLDPEEVKLWGVDFGCRTAIMYSPEDIACYWQRWMPNEPPRRHRDLSRAVARAMRIGVNVAAYATGRQPPNKLKSVGGLTSDGEIVRGFLEIPKVVHPGGWNTAPDALKNLLVALNRTVGLAATTEVRRVALSDPAIFRYPVLYMHGRTRFELANDEISQLRTYLERGGVLFADACCGSKPFDQSFREFMAELFPGRPLERIPDDHEMLNLEPGFDIRRVERHEPAAAAAGIDRHVLRGPPQLEGINLGGRYAVVYSRYDISCALERQSSVACTGYGHEDAARIAMNVILYAMLQKPAE